MCLNGVILHFSFLIELCIVKFGPKCNIVVPVPILAHVLRVSVAVPSTEGECSVCRNPHCMMRDGETIQMCGDTAVCHYYNNSFNLHGRLGQFPRSAFSCNMSYMFSSSFFDICVTKPLFTFLFFTGPLLH